MKKTLFAAAISLGSIGSAFADTDPMVRAYINIPLGSSAQSEDTAKFGLQLHSKPQRAFATFNDQTQSINGRLRLKPIIDLEFTKNGFNDARGYGVTMLPQNYQLNADGAGIAGFDWAIIVASVVAAGVIVETVSDDDDDIASTTPNNTGSDTTDDGDNTDDGTTTTPVTIADLQAQLENLQTELADAGITNEQLEQQLSDLQDNIDTLCDALAIAPVDICGPT